MKRLAIASGLTAVLAGGIIAGVAAPAFAVNSDCADNRRCAYASVDYAGQKFFSSAADSGTIDVPDNDTSSASNRRDLRMCAVNVEAGVNVIRYLVAQHTAAPTFGTYNNVTDFFWIQGSGTC